ncbi:hypothetical protein C8Q80DRAFT_1103141, partial [Daedaleopsis nitida]
WLSFSNDTEMLAGYFVLHLMCAFKNSDVLLLEGVWCVYRTIKAFVLGQKIKATAIRDHGLRLLTDFVLHLLPLGLGQDIAHPTPLQQSAQERPDFYLPFRELAPCHWRATSEDSPYHPSLNSESGAFASWCIFRALIYDSDVMHNHTTRYFCNLEAWTTFLNAQGYNADDQASVDRFFNIACYGRPQVRTKVYDTEVKWQKLLEGHAEEGRQKPVPFKEFYLWLQGKKELPDNLKLPLLGNLTAYLLATDVSYTGKVQPPTASDMGFAIHRIGKGSYKALKLLNLLLKEDKHTMSEVEDAFSCVYAHLQANIPTEHHCNGPLPVY